MRKKQLAKELRKILTDKYSSIDMAAKELNLSVGYLYQLLNGAAPITAKYLRKMRNIGITSKVLDEQIAINEKYQNEKMAILAERKHVIRIDASEMMLFKTLRKYQKKVPSKHYRELIQQLIRTTKDMK